jgi:uncharacterized protein involved in exopolysaccharide biosynthesis
MAERILELVFRHKFLLALPTILGVAAGIFALTRMPDPYFSSRAAIWVERPTALSGESIAEFNPYVSPAQNQANSMRELLGLNSFALDILQRVDPSALSGARMTELRVNTFIYPYGNHVLYLEFRARDAERAQKTVTAIVGAYTNIYKERLRDNAVRSRTFYQEQLDASRTALDKASGELTRYLAAHPDLATLDFTQLTAIAARDVDLAGLVTAERAARGNHDQTLQKFAESQISASTVDGTIPNFLLMDEPEVPMLRVSPSKRALLAPPTFGLATGVFISAVIFVVYWRLDRRVHLAEDLAFFGPDVPVMTIPRVASKRRRWPPKFVRVAAAVQNGLGPPSLSRG